jgi:hypothetical protein
MAIQLINLGNVANDGTGDDLREAFLKVNANFSDLDVRSTESTTAANLGSSGEGVFSSLVGAELQFKKIAAGAGITLNADNNAITITSSATGLNEISLFGDSGNSNLNQTDNSLTINGGANTTVTVNNNVVTIAADTVLNTDANPRLGANLDTNGFNIVGNGDVKTTVHNIDVRDFDGLQDFASGFEFGRLDGIAENFFEFFALSQDVDFGTISAPETTEVDFGSI